MKKVVLLVAIAVTFSSCATVFGGHITKHQTTKPKKGGEKRRVRVAPLIFNAWFFPIGIGIDFLTGAAYKPYKIEE